jgi:hypothetical protein
MDPNPRDRAESEWSLLHCGAVREAPLAALGIAVRLGVVFARPRR